MSVLTGCFKCSIYTNVRSANTSQNLYVTQTIEQQMRAMRVQIDKMRQENAASDTLRSLEPESGFQITDRLFALNRFLEETETAFSGSPPPSPSLSPNTSLVIEEKMAILQIGRAHV